MQKPQTCQGCSFETIGKGFVPAHGAGTNGVLIVGEAPGREEAIEGIPFVGAAGYFLDHRILKRAGLEREAFRVDNVLRCQPPGNKFPEDPAPVSHCQRYLSSEIARSRPKVILALGGQALTALTGLRGIKRHRGYVLDGPEGIPVIPTFHPAYLMPRADRKEGGGDKNPWRYITATILDTKKAVRLAAGSLGEPPRISYLLDPPVAEWDSWVQRALARPLGAPLSFDIETPGKLVQKDEGEQVGPGGPTPIIRIGFAWEVGRAVSVPWRGEYLPGIAALLGQKGSALLGWNCYGFDQLVLEQHGFKFDDVELHDGMWAWHVLQSDLDRGLEFVGGFYAHGLRPWKHLGSSEPARYNAIDADVALRNFLGTREDLLDLKQWNLYDRHVRELWPILHRAGSNGVLVDRGARGALADRLDARLRELDRDINALVPRELLSKRILKQSPKGELSGRDLERVEIHDIVRACSNCGAVGVTQAVHLKGGKKNPCKAAGAKIIKQPGVRAAWLERFPFNSEGDDLERYVAAQGHSLGRHVRTGKATLDKKALADLVRQHGAKHPIYALAAERRKLSKARGTYVYDPDANGLIHTHYTFAPSTGRLSARDYNLTNVAHGDENPFADEIRRQLIAPEGFRFVEADSSAIESVLSGFFMGDQEFINLARAGIYDYVCCYELGIEFSPAGITAAKQQLGEAAYKLARDRNKRTALGTFYGMTARMLSALYPKLFPSLRAAQGAIDLLYQACPALPEWHHTLRVTAHRQGYLQNPWGGRHWFCHVFGKNHKTGKVTLGEDAKRCVAFLPQSSAAEFMKANTLMLAKAWPNEWLPANLLVHDAYCLLAPVERVEEAIQLLVSLLTREVPELGGLRIGCEVKVGQNWADMESVRKVVI